MERKKQKIRRWILLLFTGLALIPLPAMAEETTTTITPTPATMSPPRDGSGNQYRQGRGDTSYTVSADELGLRRRSGNQQGELNGTQTRQRLRDQSGSGSQHHYGGNGSYDGSGSYTGSGGYGGGGGFDRKR